MRPSAALVVVATLLAVAATLPGGADPGVAPPGTDGAVPSDVDPGVASAAGVAAPAPAGTTIRVRITREGDARWNVTLRYDLATENDTAAFRQYAASFRAGETDARFDADLFRGFAARASDATGRSMAIRDVGRDATVRNGTGVLELSFTWTNFARTEGDRVVLGDVFRTRSGTWLSSLAPGQRLVIHAPPEYAVESASRGHENGTFEWTGPATFERDEISATFVPEARPTPTPTPTPEGPLLPGVWPAGMGFAAAVVLLLVLLLALRGMPDQGTDADRAAADPADGDDPGAEAGDVADGDDPFAGVDEELLSDEERVELLVEANGGRMMQADIVRETGWSNAKVSQLLSSMADEERLEKLRIGRENLIALPDEDVGDLGDAG